MAQSCLYIYMY